MRRKKLFKISVFCAASAVLSVFADLVGYKIAASFLSGLCAVSAVVIAFSFRKIYRINDSVKLAGEGTFASSFPSKISDEFDELLSNLSSLFKNLKEYDVLRAKDVTKASKSLSAIFSNISQAAIVLDMEEDTILLNPPARALWGLQTEEILSDLVLKKPQNADFAEKVQEVISKNNREFSCDIYFPSGINRKVNVLALPVKSAEGEITRIIMLLEPEE